MSSYNNTSPYYTTNQGVETLSILNKRMFIFEPDDIEYEIDSWYEHRPDLLAHDLYGSAKLWWVFMHRNMDVITDPIWSFKSGVVIRIPKNPNLEKYLGI